MKKNEVIEALGKINNLKNRIKSLTDKGYNPSLKISDDISYLENNLKEEISGFFKFFLNITFFQRIVLFLFICIVILPITSLFLIETFPNDPITSGIIIIFILIEITIMFYLLRFRP